MLTKFSVFCSFFLFTTFFLAAKEADEQGIPKLSVSGQANLRKPADELMMTIGVANTHTSAQEALAQNNTSMQGVINALNKLGVDKFEFQTGNFSITPTYTPYPKNPPPDWKQSINGYEVNNTIIIKTERLNMAGHIIDATSKAGANTVSNIHFGLKDPRKYWDEAIATATKNAIEDARIIANAAGVKLLRILSLSLNSSQILMPRVNVSTKAFSLESTLSTPLEPGDITITATVNVIFEIGEN